MSRLGLVLPVFVLVTAVFSQQNQSSQTPPSQKASPYASIPADVAHQANPVKSSPESLARAKKWWNIDCAMCHGKDGDGKGDVAQDMKLQLVDFTDPASLKDHTDGEIFYIIKNGLPDMPPEGPRLKADENWDLVNYVRSLAKRKPDTEQKPQ